MKFYKKVLIAIIIVIFTCIIWNLLKRREIIMRNSQKDVPRFEGFSFFSDPDSEIADLKDSNKVVIDNINPKYTNKPLREYVIKSSFNSALSGKNVNPEMIKYVLNRGCRFLDFEVFYINDRVEVAVSTDDDFNFIDTENSLLLDNVFTTIISNAFISPTPNTTDPVFIHLRIKSKEPKIYKEIAHVIDTTLRAKLYPKPVTNDTKLSEIMGKIVIVVDKTTDREYKTHTKCEQKEKGCIDLAKFINMESGSETLFLQHYGELLNQCANPPVILDNCDLCTNVNKMRLVLPDINYENTSNPDISEFILNYGCQIVPYRFYMKDEELGRYEELFNYNNSAFIPLAKAMDYIRKIH